MQQLFFFFLWTLLMYGMHRVVHSSKLLGYFHIQHHKVINNKETKWHWNNVLLYNDDMKSTLVPFNEGNDQISGETGIDNLNGGNGNDLLDGGDDEDFIKGHDGDDLIIGGNGGDIIWGQKGRDQFIYKNKFESQLSNDQELAKIINYDFEKYLYEKNNSPNFQNSSIDVILDFVQQEDLINLSNLGFDSITFEKFSNQSPSGLEYYFKDNFTIIDDPNSNFAIKIIGNIELINTDFMY